MRRLIGVGIDMVDLAQFETLVLSGGTAFQKFCWTPRELAQCRGSISHLAMCWAAKEAAMKALGRGIGDIAPTDIEVIQNDGRAPTLLLRSAAEVAAPHGDVDLSVTMSSGANLAIALVLAAAHVASAAGEACWKDQCHGTR